MSRKQLSRARFLLLMFLALGVLFLIRNRIPMAFPPIAKPSPEPAFTTYSAPKLADKKVYRIVLVGDSMTHALGPHGGRLGPWLEGKFKGKGFIIDNYAYSTNIQSLPDFLMKPTTTWNITFQPILNRDFDIIIIESFGYNPLINIPRDAALAKRHEILDATMKQLIKTKPQSLIVFLATIAPSKTMYATKTITLTQSERTNEVDERIAYIKDHREYATMHNIPLVNVFDASLTPNGDANIKWISPDDYIHPSVDGVELLSQTITNSLFDQNLIPH